MLGIKSESWIVKRFTIQKCLQNLKTERYSSNHLQNSLRGMTGCKRQR